MFRNLLLVWPAKVACSRVELALLMLGSICLSPSAFAQFSSGSDGSCGAYNPTTSGYFVPSSSSFSSCHHVANNVFDFTTITIPAGVTMTFSGWYDNAPVYWLATGNVDIEGSLILSGSPGAPCTGSTDIRVPSAPGSGGYQGGVGGNSTTGQNATAGSGPGGGAPGVPQGGGASGAFTGNVFLVPLVGGSGGGGAESYSAQFEAGGGAGGGAILIASSTQITINGTVYANGGLYGQACIYSAGVGSGGAIRLASNTITGNGALGASSGDGGGYCSAGSNPGILRLEAYINSFSGSYCSPWYGSYPTLPLMVPTVPQPSVKVSSVNGIPINANPFSFPDITINTGSPVPVVVSAQQVPVGTTAYLTVLSTTSDQDPPALSCPLAGTLSSSSCTINVTFPFAGSRGLVKTTWGSTGGESPAGPVKK